MYGYILDVFIWSFSIYGIVCFMNEYLLETVCYLITKCGNAIKLYRKHVAKIFR
ncbi:MAG: hypothetical protein IJX99_06290 [Clostridia bacterium]|nr:hypothetical protein [Clostridia bacterium]